MQTGTALNEFGIRFPKRFFDVGVKVLMPFVFAGGLAAGGSLPVFAVYSHLYSAVMTKLFMTLPYRNI